MTAIHDVSDGGILVAVAEMALAGNIGASLLCEAAAIERIGVALFAEDQGRFVATVPIALQDAVRTACQQHAIPFDVLGITGGNTIEITFEKGISEDLTSLHQIPLDALRAAHEGFFPALMDGER